MQNFENDFTNLLKTIRFCATKISFQQQLMGDIGTIKNIKETLTLADKISTFIRFSRNNAIMTSCKDVHKKTQKQINKKRKKYTQYHLNKVKNCN